MNKEIKEILSKMERLIVYEQYNAYYDLEKQLLEKYEKLQQELKEANESITWLRDKGEALEKENK